MLKNARDFYFDGRYLSDFEFIICTFGNQSDEEVVNVGSTVSIDTVSMNRGRINHKVSAKYDGVLTATFTICKDPDIYSGSDMTITNDEYRQMMRWLNGTTFRQFSFVADDEEDPCYYDGYINVDQYYIDNRLLGLQLTLTTNRPYGYGMEYKQTLNFTALQELAVNDFSDEVGFIYPDVEITLKESGNLRLSNITTGKTVAINNCTSGEKITMYGDYKIIKTDRSAHSSLSDDFNYTFLNIGNTIENRTNRLSSTLACTVKIKYRPIIK